MVRDSVAALLALLAMLPLAAPLADGWSNGGYSADPSHPDYGTHDWLAEHAMRWMPQNESRYIRDSLAPYLYGTELPDNGAAPDGIGDTTRHHVYYRANGTLQDNASAKRALEEFESARACLLASNFTGAALRAGVMSHYIVDVAVFGHVMGASTAWGAEGHHSDYETNVTNDMKSNVSARYDGYLVFDGSLDFLTAYDAALRMANSTTFGDGANGKNCTWMDANYDWSDPAFVDSTGAALNLSANLLADVLHTLAVVTGYGAQDTVPPSISISSPLDGATLDATVVNVTGTASDDVAVRKVEIGLDGANWTPCSGNVSWNGTLVLPEGASVILARATDPSNNSNSTSVMVNVSLPDVVPPSVTIDSPAEGAHLVSRNVTVAGTAADNREIQSVELGLDNLTWNPANGTASWSGNLGLSLGASSIYARATDTSGNRNITRVGVIVDDVVIPEIGITYPLNGTVISTENITITGNASDEGGIALVETGVDNITWVPCDGNTSWTGNLTLMEGQNTIYARATDASGNSNTVSVRVLVSIPDLTPPLVSITYPPEGALLSSLDVSLAGTAFDNSAISKVEASVDGSVWLPCDGTANWTGNLTLAEGNNTVFAKATDPSGNWNIMSVSVRVALPDVAPPAINITSPAGGAVLSVTGASFYGTASDNRGVSRVDLSRDNSTWVACAGTDSWTCAIVLTEGKNRIFARAFDAAGNMAFASIDVTVRLPDTTPPVVTILSPGNGSMSMSGTVRLKGEARDGTGVIKVETSLDGTNWKAASGNASWTAKVSLKEGRNTIRVRAADASGNVGLAILVVKYEPEPQLPWGLVAAAVSVLALLLLLLAFGIRRRRR